MTWSTLCEVLSLFVSIFPSITLWRKPERCRLCVLLLGPGFDSRPSACQVHTNGLSCLHSAAPVAAARTSNGPVWSSATLSALTASALRDTRQFPTASQTRCVSVFSTETPSLTSSTRKFTNKAVSFHWSEGLFFVLCYLQCDQRPQLDEEGWRILQPEEEKEVRVAQLWQLPHTVKVTFRCIIMCVHKALKELKKVQIEHTMSTLLSRIPPRLWHGCLFLGDNRWHIHFPTNTWTKYLIPLELQRLVNVLALCVLRHVP